MATPIEIRNAITVKTTFLLKRGRRSDMFLNSKNGHANCTVQYGSIMYYWQINLKTDTVKAINTNDLLGSYVGKIVCVSNFKNTKCFIVELKKGGVRRFQGSCHDYHLIWEELSKMPFLPVSRVFIHTTVIDRKGRNY